MQGGGCEITVTGLEEMLNGVHQMEKGFDRRARKAVRAGGKIVGDDLTSNTPVSGEDHSGKGPLKNHVKVGNVSVKTGDYTVDVGYDKTKGFIAHFPNSGTSKQTPQHFVEKTQEQSRDKVLQAFINNLKVGG